MDSLLCKSACVNFVFFFLFLALQSWWNLEIMFGRCLCPRRNKRSFDGWWVLLDYNVARWCCCIVWLLRAASSWNLTWKCLCSPDVRCEFRCSAPNWHFPKSSSSSTQSRFEDSSYCEKKIHSRLPWHPLLMELFRVRRICNYFITHPSTKIFCEHFAPNMGNS